MKLSKNRSQLQQKIKGVSVDFYVRDEMGKGQSYVAPDPHFVSSIALFASSLPWDKFRKFFERKKMVNLSANEQLILLRLVALQELLTLDDDSLLRWAKHQLYLFSFMQPDYQPKLPTVELLQEFRREFDKVGLLKPFRKQCQRLISEHESRLPPLNYEESISNNTTISAKYAFQKKKVSDTKVDLPNLPVNSDSACPNCGSVNVIRLMPSQEASTLPEINFSKCRFCGNTFREKKSS
ncbi:MAG: DNA-directed RNA polymerase subunit M/transcription elongation factor TFIIS [Cocleimonas sp.]